MLPESQDHFLYLSSLLRRPVRDASDGGRLGRVFDLAVRFEGVYPRVTRVLLRAGRPGRRRWSSVSWAAAKDEGRPGLSVPRAALSPVATPDAEPGEVLLREEILDRQVVDVKGAKLVRVNDIQLFRANGNLHLAHVDIGTRGLLRRLGWENAFVPVVRWLFGYSMQEVLVGFKHVHLIPEPGDVPHPGVRISLAERLTELHPAELADLMEDLNPRSREAVFQSLPLEAAADALEETEPDVQRGLIDSMTHASAADIIEQMSSPAAADLLGDLPEPQAARILGEMDEEKADTVRELLLHEDETAGGLMTKALIRLTAEKTAGEALNRLRASAADLEVVYYLFAVDAEDRLRGVVSLRDLLKVPPDSPLEPLLATKLITVRPDTTKDEVVRLFSKYRFRAIPVVDAGGVLAGAIRFRALVAAVSPELS